MADPRTAAGPRRHAHAADQSFAEGAAAGVCQLPRATSAPQLQGPGQPGQRAADAAAGAAHPGAAAGRRRAEATGWRRTAARLRADPDGCVLDALMGTADGHRRDCALVARRTVHEWVSDYVRDHPDGAYTGALVRATASRSGGRATSPCPKPPARKRPRRGAVHTVHDDADASPLQAHADHAVPSWPTYCDRRVPAEFRTGAANLVAAGKWRTTCSVGVLATSTPYRTPFRAGASAASRLGKTGARCHRKAGRRA